MPERAILKHAVHIDQIAIGVSIVSQNVERPAQMLMVSHAELRMIIDQVLHHLVFRKRVGSPGHVVIRERTILEEGSGIPSSFRRLLDDFASVVSAQTKMVRKKRRHV